jgi:GPH family glycoside/pentoside/hexuronide:cation symporter
MDEKERPTEESEEFEVLEEKIPVKSKVGFACAQTGSNILSGLGLGVIDVFYLKFTGLDPNLMALSWIIFAVWNSVNDPLIGIIQDKTKSKLGRRIPYLRYGSFVYIISFILIWFPMTDEPSLLFWNHFLMLFVFDTVYTMIGLITYSLPAEMALTEKERASIMLYAGTIGIVGVLIPIILPLIYLGENPDLVGFRTAMIIVGIISGLLIFFSSYVIKENRYAVMEESLGFFESIKETFKNKPFLILEITIFATVIMQNITTSYLVFLTDYLIDLNLKDPKNIAVLGILLVIAIIGIVWVIKNIPKYGVKKMGFYGMIGSAIGFSIFFIMGLILGPNQTNKLSMLTGLTPLIVVVIGLVVMILTSQPLMADAIDFDETLTGKRRETTYSGVNALITKPAVSIGKALFLTIIKHYGYISAEAGEVAPHPLEQPLSVSTGVLIAFCLIPTICLLIGAIALYFFPLDGPKWAATKRELQIIHKRKEAEFIEWLKKQDEQQAEEKR